jgi:uncharacterized protein (DUF1800 family)
VDERTAVRRLLDRFGFGPLPGELDARTAGGFASTLGTLLNPGSDPGVAATPEPNLGAQPDLTGPANSPTRKSAYQQLAGQERTLTLWWLDRMVATQAPLAERLTWFWHGHYATSEQKVRSAVLMQRQNNTFRQLGGKDFATLAKALLVDPAMLIWLDGEQNRIGSPNENLARESMELFMLGIGHYAETDVREAARALTGWTVDRHTGIARFVPRRHDIGAKNILGRTGGFDVNSYADVVLSQPASAQFIANRMWYRLVSSTPPPTAVLDRLLLGYGPAGDLAGLLRAIASEPSFVDSSTMLVKQPVEWAVGLMRALGVQPGQLPAKDATALLADLRGMGQVPFLPPSVGGWPADGAWLTTSAALARLRVAELVASHARLDAVTRVSASAGPRAVGDLLGVGTWTPRTTAALAQLAGNPRELVATAACAPEYVVST